MKQFTGAPLVLTVAVLLILSCTKSTPIGSELVEGDQAEVIFTDSLSISAKTILSDSILVYSPETQLGNFLWGRYEDPALGRVESGLYVQLSLDETDEPEFFGQKGVTLDSIVLSLAYDTAHFYGNIYTVPQHMQIFRVIEDMERGETYYSTRQFGIEPVPIADYQFFPNKRDSLTVVGYRGANPDTSLQIPQLRVPLNLEFAESLAALDSTQYETVDLFRSNFKGIHLKAGSPSQSILSLDLLSPASRLTLYYTKRNSGGQDVPMEYNFPFTFQSVKTVNYIHDFSTGEVADFIGDQSRGDSLLFVQGMAGVSTQIEFPTITKLRNIIVNKAILEFTVAVEDTAYAPIERMVLSYEDVDGSLILLDDVNFAVRQAALDLFGGQPKKSANSAILTYKMNIAAHLQDIVDDIRPEPLIMVPLTKIDFNESAARTILFGPGHTTFPAKLRLTYTQL